MQDASVLMGVESSFTGTEDVDLDQQVALVGGICLIPSEAIQKKLTDTQESLMFEALVRHYRDGASLSEASQDDNMRRPTYYSLRASCPEEVETVHDKARVEARLQRALISKESEAYRHLLSETAQGTAAGLVVDNLEAIGTIANGTWKRRIRIPAKTGEDSDTFKTVRAAPRDMLGAQKYLTLLATEGLEGIVLPHNSDGALDMSGNVWEWSSTMHADHPYDDPDEPEHTQAGGSRVGRGGSWLSPQELARCASRSGYYLPDSWNNHVGFRVAVSSGSP